MLEVDQALSVLQKPSRRAIEILSAILAGESAELTSSHLEKKLEREDERWRERSRPDFKERCAAAYALAQLAADYPEAQAVLLSGLKHRFWRRGEVAFLETVFQRHLICALGYVRHADCDLVAALLEIISKPDDDSNFASYGSQALSRLRDPSTEAITLLDKGYEKLGSVQTDIIKVLSTVEPTTEKVVCILLRNLSAKSERVCSAAAIALGNLKKPRADVLDALLASVRDNVSAAEAIGQIADRLSLADSVKMQPRLDKAAEALEEILRRAGPRYYYSPMGRGGEDVVRQALNRVVARLVEAEVAAL